MKPIMSTEGKIQLPTNLLASLSTINVYMFLETVISLYITYI